MVATDSGSESLFSDRSVLARRKGSEIVRYDRRGHYYEEDADAYPFPFRRRLSLNEAVRLAVMFRDSGGELFLGRVGATTFDRKVGGYMSGPRTTLLSW